MVPMTREARHLYRRMNKIKQYASMRKVRITLLGVGNLLVIAGAYMLWQNSLLTGVVQLVAGLACLYTYEVVYEDMVGGKNGS